jgi:DNA repair exonuclease SbcCD ATPase subunit
MADTALREVVLGRLEAGTTPEDSWSTLVLAALDGAEAIAGYLDGQMEPRKTVPSETQREPDREPLGAYLKAITVEGFRGIGQRKTLELPPGPGLTLVVGRNGSGKSSFAEALELLVTGDTYRWANRAKVWRDGWRNLQHKTAAIEAEFLVEGEKGATRLASRWKDDAGLDDVERFAQVHGRKQMAPAELGWEQALGTYRPFLSYNELGSMLDAGPSRLFDALSAILGLEELTEAQETLAEARKQRERAHKDAALNRDWILETLRQTDDDRARGLVAAIERKDWGLDEVQTVLTRESSNADEDGLLPILRQLGNLQAPAGEAVAAITRELREAQARQKATAGTLAARSKDLAEILDHALRFHQRHGDGDCPVCGRKGALDTAWHEQQAKEARALRDAAREATDAQSALDAARKRALALPAPPPDSFAKASQIGIEATKVTQALEAWWSGFRASDVDLEALARHIESTAGPLAQTVVEIRERASAEIQRREDRWKPLVPTLLTWLDQARKAQQGAAAVKPLKAAEAWLKNAAAEIRNERFAPIKEKAQQLWSKLRLESNVALRDILLTGSATKRQVDLKVTVDDVEGAALGVMSQGEQNALALSLFIPRATLPESPFRFVVIDDPVQSMDPSRIDGLARVLHETAGKRQVVVFTHDDRLPEAVRRLGIPATVIEVTRREGSALDLRVAKDPVARSIEDAMALTYTDGLPPDAARRVIPGLCREALEAACMETVRRRRIGGGQAHAEVEAQLLKAQKLSQLAALALFDDMERGGEVMKRINRESRSAGDAFMACNGGAHGQFAGVLVDFVRDAEKFARWMQRLP